MPVILFVTIHCYESKKTIIVQCLTSCSTFIDQVSLPFTVYTLVYILPLN